jgi:hypothetical protein
MQFGNNVHASDTSKSVFAVDLSTIRSLVHSVMEDVQKLEVVTFYNHSIILSKIKYRKYLL